MTINQIMKVKKKVYEVEVARPKIGCQVWNYFENSFYTVSEDQPFVLRGTMGEEWIVDEKVLKKNYCQMDGSEIESDGITHFFTRIQTKADNQNILYAKQTHGEQCEVHTAWGDVLTANREGVPHGDGDYIVAADEEFKDSWVVNGLLFIKTYTIV